MNNRPINNMQERGSVTVLTLLALVILTLLGIAALNRTRSDIGITQNEFVYRNNLARAEAAVRQGVAEVKAARVKPGDAGAPSWLYNFELPNPDIMSDTNWGPSSEPVIDQDCRFVVVYSGITYDDTDARGIGTKDYEYQIYGRSNADGGAVMVQVGYVLSLNAS